MVERTQDFDSASERQAKLQDECAMKTAEITGLIDAKLCKKARNQSKKGREVESEKKKPRTRKVKMAPERLQGMARVSHTYD